MVKLKAGAFSVQAGYRNRDAVILGTGFSKWDFSLAYSYDLTISQLGKTGGSHEIHLGYSFAKDRWSNTRANLQRFF